MTITVGALVCANSYQGFDNRIFSMLGIFESECVKEQL